MNTDVRLSISFWAHPKTKKLIKRLGLEAVRSLQILWLFAVQERPDGNLGAMDWEDIEIAADWQGDEKVFYNCLMELGFIDFNDNTHVLHNWEERNPWQAEADARSKKARDAANARWGKRDNRESQKDNAAVQVEQSINDAQKMLEQTSGDALACSNYAQALPKHDLSNAPLLSSPEEKNSLSYAHARVDEQPKSENAKGPSLDFVELRQRYDEVGRQEGKHDGYAEFLALKKSGELVGNALTLMDAVDVWATSGDWNGDYVGQFAPKLSKFLASGQWQRKPKHKVPVPKTANKTSLDTGDGNEEARRAIERTRALCTPQRAPEEQAEINRRNIAKMKSRFKGKRVGAG